MAGFGQRTFHTPLDRLSEFVACLLVGEPPIVSASVTVKQVVFAPQHLEKLLTSHQLPLDFYFVPQPKRFILYADHDEYTTLFAPRKGTLSLIASGLKEAGFKEVSDYVRQF